MGTEDPPDSVANTLVELFVSFLGGTYLSLYEYVENVNDEVSFNADAMIYR